MERAKSTILGGLPRPPGSSSQPYLASVSATVSGASIRLSEDLPSLAALGVAGPEELFEPGGAPDRRGEPVRGRAGDVRFPLPGTPGGDGRLTGRPGEAGTGWVVLRRWRRAPWGELLRSRFTPPRSTSLAEREWNLAVCLLRHGVAVPRPLAVGTRGRGLVGRDSFLVQRELTGFEPLATFLRQERRPGPRRRALRALGLFLANLLRSGVDLPRLAVADLVVKAESEEHAGDDACDAHAPAPGLRLRRRPGIALLRVEGGVLRERLGEREVGALLRRLRDEALAGSLLDPGEELRVALVALRGRRDGRALLAALGRGRPGG